MRSLTDAEARTIAVFLGSAAAPERERLARSGLPRSTYHAARRRAYDEGWLTDRYVPEPERFGYPIAIFVVARPFADRFEELVARWSNEPGLVAMWGGRGAILATFLCSTGKEADGLVAGASWKELVSSSNCVVADLHGPSVPVYFDFEGLWTHLAGIEGMVAYPRGLGGSPAPEDGGTPPLTDHQRWAASELLARPFQSERPGGRLVGPLGLPFSQKRLVAKGWVNHRVFLDPSKLASYRGNAADVYVFVSGTPKPGSRPELLFQTLVRECQTFPFLFVASPSQILIGGLGASNPKAGPSGLEGGGQRRPVMPLLNEAMSGIALLQVPAASLPVLVDHRYDHILLGPSPARTALSNRQGGKAAGATAGSRSLPPRGPAPVVVEGKTE